MSAVTRFGKLPRWVPEGILILVSVALGFGAAQYGEYRDDHRLTTRILRGVEAEVAHNLALLEPMVPFHRAWVAALADAEASDGEAGLDVWFATRPEFPDSVEFSFPMLRRSAWDAAAAGGSLRLLDYDVIAAVSETYRMQGILADNVNRLATGALSQTATFDPASRAASVRLLWLTLADIQSAEVELLRLYRLNLPVVQRAAAANGTP